jgi:SET domain-containing protein
MLPLQRITSMDWSRHLLNSCDPNNIEWFSSNSTGATTSRQIELTHTFFLKTSLFLLSDISFMFNLKTFAMLGRALQVIKLVVG